MSLPTEINSAQEKLLHDILDEGISEMRASGIGELPKPGIAELRRSRDIQSEFSATRPHDTIPDSPLIMVKQRAAQSSSMMAQQRSSALAQAIEEIKNGASDPVLRESQDVGKYGNMQNELSFLQNKIRSLEDRFATTSKSVTDPLKENQPEAKFATEPAARKSPAGVKKSARKVVHKESSSSDSDSSSSDSDDNPPPAKRQIVRRSVSRGKSIKARSTSVTSLRGSFAESLAKSTKVEDRYNALKRQYDDTKQQLVKERQKTHELGKKLDKYEREYNMKKSVYEELRETKSEYEQLKVSFEKSEKLRRHQKEIIKELQEEVGKLKDQSQQEQQPLTKGETKSASKPKKKKEKIIKKKAQ